MESRVRFSLFQTIQQTDPHFDISEIDDIVTSYVMGILQELVDAEDPEEMFDIECFREMLQAYLPASELVKDEKLSDCVMKLVKELKDDRDSKEMIGGVDIKSLIAHTTQQQPATNNTVKKNRSVSETSEEMDTKKKKAGGSRSSEGAEDEKIEAGVQLLLEMFPTCCKVEAVHCLTMMGGDIDRAVQLIITRAEMGQDIKPNQTQMLSKLTKPAEIDDSQLKKKIMDQYGFVDKEDDRRYHRPSVSKKAEDKKLIRYREGKIVSTKGERFTQVTKEESLEMKRTIVNIPSA
eukprot:TRINITY_DN8941_c0_g1_i1.p1 TRINITY_DN8941_c0_g1~~TRINITY_DN8941_c0_g1_i1.p1  ORF type:complete len:292 (-),score=107.22 TRINITY_DN8941_c0_g1_i1:345-1220(-)